MNDDAGLCSAACETFDVIRVDQTIPVDAETTVCEGSTASLPIPAQLITGIETESIITDPTGVASIVGRTVEVNTTGLAAGQYDIIYEVDNSINGANTATLTVNVDEQVGNVSVSDITTCQATPNLTALTPTPSSAVGTWSIISQPSGQTASVTELNNPTSQIGTLIQGVTSLEWSVSNGVCPVEIRTLNINQVGELTSPSIAIDGTPITGTTYEMCVGETIAIQANGTGLKPTESASWITGFTGSTASQSYTAVAGTPSFTMAWEITTSVPGCSPENKQVVVTINDKPQGGTIAPVVGCEGTNVTVSVTGVTGADSYSWSSTGATQAGSSTTSTADFTLALAPTTSATFTVIPSNLKCGAGTAVIGTGTINLKPSGGSMNPNVPAICASDNPASVTFSLTGVANTPTSYTWSTGTAPATGGTSTSTDVTVNLTGVAGTSYQVSVTPENACGPGGTIPSSVTVVQPAVITVGLSSAPFCEDTEGLLVTASPSDPTLVGEQYRFSVGSTVVGYQASNETTFAQGIVSNGDVITVEVDLSGATGCFVTSTPPTNTTIADGYKIPQVTIISDVPSICEEDEFGARNRILLTATVSPATSKGLQSIGIYKSGSITSTDYIEALPGTSLTNPTLSTSIGSPSQTGDYIAEAKNNYCPLGSTVDPVSVIIYQEPNIVGLLERLEDGSIRTIDSGIIKRPIQRGLTQPVSLDLEVLVSPILDANYVWEVAENPSVLISYQDSLSTYEFIKQINDELTIGVSNGSCYDTETYTIFYYYPLTVPNAFSPNGDGVNDKWYIYGLTDFPNAIVSVYNRWGNRLYEEKYTEENAWDGKGSAVGTYYYIIKLNKEGYPEALTGSLTITR